MKLFILILGSMSLCECTPIYEFTLLWRDTGLFSRWDYYKQRCHGRPWCFKSQFYIMKSLLLKNGIIKSGIHKISKGVPGSFWWALVTQFQAFGSPTLSKYFPLIFDQLISKKNHNTNISNSTKNLNSSWPHFSKGIKEAKFLWTKQRKTLDSPRINKIMWIINVFYIISYHSQMLLSPFHKQGNRLSHRPKSQTFL